METENKYKMILFYFQMGVWTLDMVKNAVRKKWITSEEYKQITGEEYKI